MECKLKIGRQEVVARENVFDRMVGIFDPIKAEQRLRSRLNMAVIGGYTGGSRSKRSLREYVTTSGDADSDIITDLPILRERARDLYRNNTIAASAINTNITNIVGTGLVLQSRVDREVLNLSEDQADTLEEDIERAFKLWAESPECDAARTINFYSHQGLAFQSMLENGDVFYSLPNIKRKNVPFNLRLQAIEADRVTNKDYKADNNTLAGGIELDSNGAPVAYHILKQHPGSMRAVARDWQIVQAYGSRSGRRNILHLFDQRRPGQRRGVPYLAPVIDSLKQLGRYTDAELMAAVVSGMFTVFIKTASGDSLDLPNDDTADQGLPDDYKLGNGNILSLGVDDDVSDANPGRPNVAFDPFTISIIRQIGAALQIPYELLIKHFTASFSASQAAFLEAWKYFKTRRKWLADYFCDPVFEAWFYEAVGNGTINAPGFFTNPAMRKAYLGALWIGPPKGSIDEGKQNKADAQAEDRGWKTKTQNTAERGGEFNSNVKRLSKETQMMKDAGLIQIISEESEPVMEPATEQGTESATMESDAADIAENTPEQ